MRLITKPNRWSCILAAFAMAMDVSVEELLSVIEHDGSEIAFPGLSEPMCRRGFHVQELIHAALWYDLTVTPYELMPAILPTPYPENDHGSLVITQPRRKRNFEIIVEKHQGVITGRGFRCNHAVAFEKGQIFDPDGRTYPFSFQQCESLGFYAQCVWLVLPIES